VQEKFTPSDARASTKAREEARRRFNEASQAYFLLIHSGCSPQRLECAAAAMDRWAARLA
jgi:hypothetical protein